jgi:hypothetical protein
VKYSIFYYIAVNIVKPTFGQARDIHKLEPLEGTDSEERALVKKGQERI